MSKYIIDSETLTDIADAIRTKTGKSDTITPLQMPAEIESISGGGDANYWAAEKYDSNGIVTNVRTKFIGSTDTAKEFGSTVALNTSATTEYYYFQHNAKTLPTVGANISTYAKTGTLGSGQAVANAITTKNTVSTLSAWLQQAYYISDWHSFVWNNTTGSGTQPSLTNPRWCLYNKSGVIKYVYTSLANFKNAINNGQISEDEPLAIMIIADRVYSSLGGGSVQTLTISHK